MSLPEPRRPVTPTRVIPAGAPLPARAPEPGELPPWRTPPPPPPPPVVPDPVPRLPDPAPQPMVVQHVHEVRVTLADPEPQPDPPMWARAWDWAWGQLFTWRMLAAVLAALLPWAYGRSPVSIWAHTVHQARTDTGIGTAYFIAGVAIAAAWALDRHTGRVVPRFLLVTALLGGLGVLSWLDPILALTGVHPS
ncbi:hypothetical protein [Streptomyces sp. L2]|uniref:hypothetical protein n=1 Tax=Streptomyces sp. L2 TaxID=2162665 RepID=UPI001011DE89|nr:hypothetical protein [Streptomyces sp. L2]